MGRHSGPAVDTAAQRVRTQGDSKNVRAWPNRQATVSVATASPAIPRAGPTEPCLGGGHWAWCAGVSGGSRNVVGAWVVRS